MERSKNASFAPIYTEKKLKLEASIELASKKMDEEMPVPSPPPILFYSPNRVPEELAPDESLKTTTTTIDSGAEDVTHRPLTLGMPTMHSLKMSTSLADLWPSRFPTDEEDELQMGGGMNATGDDDTMVRSSVFTSSILEEGASNNNKGTIEALSSKPEMKPNQAQDPSRSSRFQRHNRRLSRIFRNFRHQLDRTKATFRASLNNADEWKKQQRVPMPTSRSFPIASSSSMISLENYWWRSIRHREAAVPTSPKDRFFITTEAFTAAKPEHLSVQPGQKLEMLHANQLDQSAEFVKVAAVMEGNGAGNGASGAGNSSLKGHPQQRGPVGLVPRRILLPLAPSSPAGTADPAEASTSSTSQAYEDSAAAAGSSKRTSIRRFFTSNQKAESSGKNNHRHQHPNSSPAERPTSSSSASSALRTAEESGAASAHHHQLQPSTSVLSPSSQPTVPTTTVPSSQSQQNNSSTGPSTSTGSALNNNDIDLPPPMDQLGASGTSATGAAAGDEAGEGMAGTAMPVEEQQQNNTCNSGTPAAGVEPSSSTTATTTAGTTAGTPVEQMSPEESAKLKRSYVIQELVETERAYVVDLATIVDGYIGTLREMELPDEDREKVKIIFANIEQILDFHKSFFCKEIEKSLLDYEACGNAFIKYERRLHTFYVKYCQNKPKSDFLISQDNFEQLFSDIREKLGHKVALTDLLIKPVQRITKYQLMLNDILKYTHRAKDRADVLERAHDVMRVVPKACDDMMQVGRLQGFQGNLNAQGRLIHQGTLSISDGGTNQPFKGKDRRVFLFEQSVIIAECIPPRKEYGNPLYNFKNQIMVNKMQLLEEQVPDEPLRFVLQSNDPNQVATYVAQATSAEEKAQWLAKLSAQLDQQKTFLAALVDPKRYQSQLANSMGSVNISGKKDSSGSLGTPTSPAPPTGLGISPAKQQTTTAHGQQHKSSSSSKLFGFGKQKS